MRTAADHNLRQLVGIPYKDRGRGFDGADCWGIVVLFHRHVMGSALPEYLQLYESADDAAQATLAFALGKGSWNEVLPPYIQQGDAVLLRVLGYPRHCGVLTGNGYEFLHTLRGRNSTLESLDDISWRNRIEGVYRWAH